MQRLLVLRRWLFLALALTGCGASTGLLGCAAEEGRASAPALPRQLPEANALQAEPAWVSLDEEDWMAIQRYGHTATLLKDGRVLVAGGMRMIFDEMGAELWPESQDSVDLFDPRERAWMPVVPMHQARSWHTATLLEKGCEGCVLVVGGAADDAPPEVFDPGTGEWTSTDPIPTPREGSPVTMSFTATLLPDGRVLVAGGYSDHGPVARAYLFDPGLKTWTATAPMLVARSSHSATLLHDGHVLVAGGNDGQTLVASAELFDPVHETWAPAAGMATARREHTATLLGDGNVLIAGGQGNFRVGVLDDAELFIRDSFTGRWTTVPGLQTGRINHSATLLQDGRVLLAGGGHGERGFVSSADLFDPESGRMTRADSMTASRSAHTATLLADGTVLITGGQNETGFLESVELFDPRSPMWTRAKGEMRVARIAHSAVRLPGGRVLVAGGFGDSEDAYKTAEIFDPESEHFTPTASTSVARALSEATLTDGHVLITGSLYDNDIVPSAELFDPVRGVWSPTGAMYSTRFHHALTLLDEAGHVLASGGSGASGTLNTAEVYDPRGRDWTLLPGTMNVTRMRHTATLLADGSVLAAGGEYSDVGSSPLDSAELWDARTMEWTSTQRRMSTPRALHTATRLRDGRVLLVGGTDSKYVEDGAELFDPQGQTWTPTATPSTPDRFNHTATLLDNTCVLIAGGRSGGLDLSDAELFDPLTDTWTLAPRMNFARSGHTATLLEDGRVLITGGSIRRDAPRAAELFTPLPPGESCTTRCECQSGHCVDGICCDRACDGPCEACSGSTGGICTTPDLPSGATCATDCECQSGHCVDGICCDRACDSPCETCSRSSGAVAEGVCTSRDPECSPFTCAPETGQCMDRCTSVNDCAPGYACDLSGKCVLSLPDPSFLDTLSCSLPPPRPARSTPGWSSGIGLLSLSLLTALRRKVTPSAARHRLPS